MGFLLDIFQLAEKTNPLPMRKRIPKKDPPTPPFDEYSHGPAHVLWQVPDVHAFRVEERLLLLGLLGHL